MSFFVMSFVDLVGIGVDRVKSDMGLSATMAQLIPSATFLWFLLLSVPVGVLQSRYGKRLVLNIGMAVTAIGLFIPFFIYSFISVLAGFAFLGIGNTIVQVSANPLLVAVVPSDRASSFLSFSQFVKAIGSMIGAPLAGYLAAKYGDWKLLFLIFGLVSVLTVLWLSFTRIEESGATTSPASLASSFGLLGNRFILLMVLSIFVVVGIDVGFNSNSGQFLIHHFSFDQLVAEKGRSIYFFGRMIGTFSGALLLTRIASRKFFMWSSVLGIISLIAMLSLKGNFAAWGMVFITGLAVSNIFPVVFSIAVEKYPDRTNEISGLMMMAIVGGAVFPLLMGWITDISSNAAGMSVILFSFVYLLVVSLYALKR